MICQKNMLKKCIGCVLILVSVVVLIFMAAQTVTDDIWYDEVFSLCFIKGSIGELIKLTARDVHPPFYYIYLKVMAAIIGLIPGVGLVTAAKLASVIPGVGLLIIALTYIRKRFGHLAMGLFSWLVICMPQIGNYYVEIRMYSLALLMITGAGLLALSIIQEGSRTWKWVILWLLGILTAYTQYYACIGIVGVYASLLIMILVGDKGDRKSLINRLLICVAASVVIYIPWLPTLLRQATTVNGSYWIQPLTIRSIAGCIKFITLPVAPYGAMCYIAAGLVIAAIGLMIILNLIKRRDKELINLLTIGFIPLAVIILSGFVLSIIGTPIFVYRYMVPALGLMWLVVSILVDRMWEDSLVYFIASFIAIMIFAFAGKLSIKGFYLEEHKKVLFMEDTKAALESLEDDAVLICNFDHVASVIGYRMDNRVCLYEADIDGLIPDMLHGTGEFVSDEDVAAIVRDNPHVYFLGSFNSRDEILDKWSEQGITGSEQASVLLERYWFNIYKLGMK